MEGYRGGYTTGSRDGNHGLDTHMALRDINTDRDTGPGPRQGHGHGQEHGAHELEGNEGNRDTIVLELDDFPTPPSHRHRHPMLSPPNSAASSSMGFSPVPSPSPSHLQYTPPPTATGATRIASGPDRDMNSTPKPMSTPWLNRPLSPRVVPPSSSMQRNENGAPSFSSTQTISTAHPLHPTSHSAYQHPTQHSTHSTQNQLPPQGQLPPPAITHQPLPAPPTGAIRKSRSALGLGLAQVQTQHQPLSVSATSSYPNPNPNANPNSIPNPNANTGNPHLSPPSTAASPTGSGQNLSQAHVHAQMLRRLSPPSPAPLSPPPPPPGVPSSSAPSSGALGSVGSGLNSGVGMGSVSLPGTPPISSGGGRQGYFPQQQLQSQQLSGGGPGVGGAGKAPRKSVSHSIMRPARPSGRPSTTDGVVSGSEGRAGELRGGGERGEVRGGERSDSRGAMRERVGSERGGELRGGRLNSLRAEHASAPVQPPQSHQQQQQSPPQPQLLIHARTESGVAVGGGRGGWVLEDEDEDDYGGEVGVAIGGDDEGEQGYSGGGLGGGYGAESNARREGKSGGLSGSGFGADQERRFNTTPTPILPTSMLSTPPILSTSTPSIGHATHAGADEVQSAAALSPVGGYMSSPGSRSGANSRSGSFTNLASNVNVNTNVNAAYSTQNVNSNVSANGSYATSVSSNNHYNNSNTTSPTATSPTSTSTSPGFADSPTAASFMSYTSSVEGRYNRANTNTNTNTNTSAHTTVSAGVGSSVRSRGSSTRLGGGGIGPGGTGPVEEVTPWEVQAPRKTMKAGVVSMKEKEEVTPWEVQDERHREEEDDDEEAKREDREYGVSRPMMEFGRTRGLSIGGGANANATSNSGGNTNTASAKGNSNANANAHSNASVPPTPTMSVRSRGSSSALSATGPVEEVLPWEVQGQMMPPPSPLSVSSASSAHGGSQYQHQQVPAASVRSRASSGALRERESHRERDNNSSRGERMTGPVEEVTPWEVQGIYDVQEVKEDEAGARRGSNATAMSISGRGVVVGGAGLGAGGAGANATSGAGAMSVRSRASSAGMKIGGTGPVEEVTPWEVQEREESVISSSGFVAYGNNSSSNVNAYNNNKTPSVRSRGSSAVSMMLVPQSPGGAGGASTGSVEDVTPWEMFPVPSLPVSAGSGGGQGVQEKEKKEKEKKGMKVFGRRKTQGVDQAQAQGAVGDNANANAPGLAKAMSMMSTESIGAASGGGGSGYARSVKSVKTTGPVEDVTPWEVQDVPPPLPSVVSSGSPLSQQQHQQQPIQRTPTSASIGSYASAPKRTSQQLVRGVPLTGPVKEVTPWEEQEQGSAWGGSSVVERGVGVGRRSVEGDEGGPGTGRGSMTLEQLEQVMPWELHPAPQMKETTATSTTRPQLQPQQHGRANTSSTHSSGGAVAHALAELGIRSRRSTGTGGGAVTDSTVSEGVSAGLPSGSGSGSTPTAVKRRSNKLSRMSTSASNESKQGISSSSHIQAAASTPEAAGAYPGPHPASSPPLIAMSMSTARTTLNSMRKGKSRTSTATTSTNGNGEESPITPSTPFSAVSNTSTHGHGHSHGHQSLNEINNTSSSFNPTGSTHTVASGTSKSSGRSHPSSSNNTTQNPTISQTNVDRFSTADRTILAELHARLHARDSQFTLKGVGQTVIGGGRSAGKRYHAFGRAVVPYPRSYGREVVDHDAWETLFSMDVSSSITWHVFDEPPQRVLDLGCGSGMWILHCARIWRETQFVGLDVVPLHPDLENLGAPELAARVTWVQHNFLEGLPFQDGEFDFVRIKRVALGVPEDKWDTFFEEIARVMKPGGRLEMLEEDLFFPGKKVDEDDDDDFVNYGRNVDLDNENDHDTTATVTRRSSTRTTSSLGSSMDRRRSSDAGDVNKVGVIRRISLDDRSRVDEQEHGHEQERGQESTPKTRNAPTLPPVLVNGTREVEGEGEMSQPSSPVRGSVIDHQIHGAGVGGNFSMTSVSTGVSTGTVNSNNTTHSHGSKNSNGSNGSSGSGSNTSDGTGFLRPTGGSRHHAHMSHPPLAPNLPSGSASVDGGFVLPHSRSVKRPALVVKTAGSGGEMKPTQQQQHQPHQSPPPQQSQQTQQEQQPQKQQQPYPELMFNSSVSVLGSMGYLAYQDPLAQAMKRQRKLDAIAGAGTSGGGRSTASATYRSTHRSTPSAVTMATMKTGVSSSTTAMQKTAKRRQSPFLSTLMAQGPVNPRNHTILEAVWDGMLEGRFVNPAPISLLTTYLEYHFKDVRTHAPVVYTFPPILDSEDSDETETSSKAKSKFNIVAVHPDTDKDTVFAHQGRPRSTKSTRSGSLSESAASDEDDDEHQKWLSMRSLVDQLPYVSLDESRADAVSPSTAKSSMESPVQGKATPVATSMSARKMGPRGSAARLPSSPLHTDPRTLHLHLTLRAKEIVACSESMWEWVEEFQAGPAGDAARRMGKGGGSPEEELGSDPTRAVILDMTREDFDRLLCNFEWDMLDKASLGGALKSQFGWNTFDGPILLDLKAYRQACEKYEEWVEMQLHTKKMAAAAVVAAAEQNTHSRHQSRNSISTPGNAIPSSSSDLNQIARSHSSPEPSTTTSAGVDEATAVNLNRRGSLADPRVASTALAYAEAVAAATPPLPTQMLSRRVRVFVAWKAG